MLECTLHHECEPVDVEYVEARICQRGERDQKLEETIVLTPIQLSPTRIANPKDEVEDVDNAAEEEDNCHRPSVDYVEGSMRLLMEVEQPSDIDKGGRKFS